MNEGRFGIVVVDLFGCLLFVCLFIILAPSYFINLKYSSLCNWFFFGNI